MLFEKIFQRDDKSFLLLYYFFLCLVLYLSSILAYYVRNNSWQLPELIFEGTPFDSLRFKITNQILPGSEKFFEPAC